MSVDPVPPRRSTHVSTAGLRPPILPTRGRRLIGRSLSAIVLTGTFLYAAAPAANAGPTLNLATPAAGAETITQHVQVGGVLGSNGIAQGPLHGVAVGHASQTSTIWAGYVALKDNASGNPVVLTTASAAFVVPTLACSPTVDSRVALWVGVDGYGTAGVEQTGIDAHCVGGRAVYTPWYEMFPAPAVNEPQMVVRAGDSVTATV
jgi:hypothetical protein